MFSYISAVYRTLSQIERPILKYKKIHLSKQLISQWNRWSHMIFYQIPLADFFAYMYQTIYQKWSIRFGYVARIVQYLFHQIFPLDMGQSRHIDMKQPTVPSRGQSKNGVTSVFSQLRIMLIYAQVYFWNPTCGQHVIFLTISSGTEF